MQLVAGRSFFFNGANAYRVTRTASGVGVHQPPAMTMQWMGWTPFMYTKDIDPDSVVRVAQAAGAMGLKLYAQLDSVSVRRLVDAAHRAGMPVWGHAWVQPASVREQSTAGQDGVVHAAGLAGELYSAEDRDTLVADGDLQAATALAATPEAAHDPRILAALDTMAARGTMFEPTLDATRRSVAGFDMRNRHVPSLQEAYVRAARAFGMEVTREAIKRGVRISAGSDHVSIAPPTERATLFGELQLYVDSIGIEPDRGAPDRDARRRARDRRRGGQADRDDRAGELCGPGAAVQESAGRHPESRVRGVGDARRGDLAAGAAQERDRDAVGPASRRWCARAADGSPLVRVCRHRCWSHARAAGRVPSTPHGIAAEALTGGTGALRQPPRHPGPAHPGGCLRTPAPPARAGRHRAARL